MKRLSFAVIALALALSLGFNSSSISYAADDVGAIAPRDAIYIETKQKSWKGQR